MLFGPLCLIPCIGWATGPAEVIEIGSRRELFVDRHLVDTMDGARLTLARPCDEGVVLRFDRPWEGLFSGYATVIRDGGLLRLYYRGHADDSKDGSPSEVTCYAESTDGIEWVKPDLDLFTVQGTRDNNVVLADAAPVTHNFCPFLDANPKAASDERFKAVGGTAESGLVGYASADGLHWSKLQKEPVFRDKGWVFDSQNVPFWSESEGCYVLYYRRAAGGRRAIARATSPDFRTWSEPVQMGYSDTGDVVPSHELYTNQTQPYFRAPHLYVSTAARFMKGRQVITDEEAAAIGVHPKYFGDTSDAVLMTSRGGGLYDRTFLEGFLRPGIGAKNWVSRTNYPALNVVQTGDHEMSLYVNQDYGQPTAHLHRYSLRLDGFASVRASAAGGTLVTKPLVFEGDRLSVNLSTSAAGSVRVEIQDAAGSPLPGFSFDDSRELIGNEIDRTVSWKNGSDVSSLAGKPVRLKFVMQDADLFAFQFLKE
ncbi:MAG: hypothetical protein WBC44_15520 [Planctomycetaceae bacterium]